MSGYTPSELGHNIQILFDRTGTMITYILYVAPVVIVYVSLLLYDQKSRSPKGCRRLGTRGRSQLADEFHDGCENSQSEWKVESLWIYPIKSCSGIELEEASVVSTGLEYDRQFSLAHQVPAKGGMPQRWEFISQRNFGLMARVMTEVWVPDPSSPTYNSELPAVQSGGVIAVRFPVPRKYAILDKLFPQWKSFTIPFNPTAAQIEQGNFLEEKLYIWKDSPLALGMGSVLPPELAQFLGVRTKLSLFRVSHENYREVFRCAPRKEELGWQPIVGFADSFPIHLLNHATVQKFAHTMAKELPRLSIRRFRSNIIVTGPKPDSEETWKNVRIGDFVYYVSCRTVRCKLPNVDPDTGERHPAQPDKNLRKLRENDKGAKNGGCLGMQLVPAKKEGIIRVGDPIHVLEVGEHVYIRLEKELSLITATVLSKQEQHVFNKLR